jgi:hypothetical protein
MGVKRDVMMASRSDLGKFIFALLLLIHLLPIWIFHHLPTSDGPDHVANAYTLRHYRDPAYPEFRQYYELNPKPVPNYLTHLVLMALMYVVSSGIAEKLFLSVYVILLPLAARYALAAVGSEAESLSLLVFPFIYNFLFHLGFYNFSIGLPMFFFAVGYWLRHHKAFSAPQTGVLALLLFITYFSHILPFVVVSLIIGTLSLTACWREARSSSQWSWAAIRYLLPPVVAATPSVAFAIAYFAGRNNHPRFEIGITDRLMQFAACYSLVSYAKWELVFALGVAAIFACIGVSLLLKGRHETQQGGPFLAAAASCATLYLITPGRFGSGSHIAERLLLFVYFSVLLWFGAHSFTRNARRAIQASALIVSLFFLVGHAVKYRLLNVDIDEYLTVMNAISPHSTVFPIVLSFQAPDGHELTHRVPPSFDLASWIVVERGGVTLFNYEGWVGDFPLLYREKLNPFVQLSSTPRGLYRNPPEVDLIGYPRRTGGTVDYVIVWSTRAGDLETRGKSILSQLNQAYDLFAVSTPHGYGRLYRARSQGLDPRVPHP